MLKDGACRARVTTSLSKEFENPLKAERSFLSKSSVGVTFTESPPRPLHQPDPSWDSPPRSSPSPNLEQLLESPPVTPTNPGPTWETPSRLVEISVTYTGTTSHRAPKRSQ